MTTQDYIHHTSELIKLPTTSYNNEALKAAIDYIAGLIHPFEGITIERFEQNGVPSLLAYYGSTRPQKFDLILNGHIDVVPGKPHQYIPRLEGTKLYGRGAYDMKLATVVMTDIFCRIAPQSPLNIGLQIVADEEVGGYDGVVVQLQQGVRADFVIFGEMTDLGVCNESRGICWTELAFTGRTAHGGYPWDGVNAVTRASNFAQAVLKKFPIPAQKTWRTTANIAALTTGNTIFNQVPEEATLKIDFRFTPESPHFKNRQTVKALIASIDPTAVLLDILVFDPAVNVHPEHPSLRSFLGVYSSLTGQEATLIKRYASSDARHYAALAIPTIEFGVGGKALHADDEYADIASIGVFKATLEKYILQGQSPATKSLVGANTNVH